MYRPLVVLALGTFAIGTDSFVVAGLLPGISASLDVDVTAAGQLVTAYALAYALLSPVAAALTARWPRRRVLLAGLGVFVLGNLATAVLPSYGLVLVSRALAGLGGALFTPTATATAAALVPAERRGRAIAVVIAGSSGATALGAPLGTLVGSLGDWRTTMLFVALLGTAAGLGVAVLLPTVSAAPVLGLRQRLAPLGNPRLALTLAAVFTVYAGLFVVYTYVSLGFDRATGGDGGVLAALLLVWGVAATAGNLSAGGLTDRFGSRRIITTAAAVAALDFALLPLTSAHLPTAVVALIVWALCGWGMLVPFTHRLIGFAPASAPLLTALNSTAVYLGVSASGLVGAAGLALVGPHRLGLVGAAFIVAGLVLAESAQRARRQPARPAESDTTRSLAG